MAAKEVREYRTLSKKLVEIEERGRMLVRLQKKRIFLTEEELFVQNLQTKFKILGDKKGVRGKQREEVMAVTMKYKVKDNNLYGIKVRRRRNYLRGKLESEMGNKSKEWKKLMEEVKKNCDKVRKPLKLKFDKKVGFLMKKYGAVKRSCDVDDDLLRYMGDPEVFKYDVRPDVVREPVVVSSRG